MTQLSFPSPAHNARNVTDLEYERIAARFSDDGIWGIPADTSVIFTTTGLQVFVRAGKRGSLRGHAWFAGAVDDTLTIGANSSGQTRIDRVVLRLDRATWTVRAVVKPGTPGAGAPVLTQDVGDTGTFEIQLARVTVPNGASSVTVQREELYIGSRIKVANSTDPNLFPQQGEIGFEPDTGRWRGYNGAGRVTLYEDSGLLNISPGFSAWEQVFANVGRLRNDWVWLRVWVERKDSTFTDGDPDGSKIGVLPNSLKSTYNNFFTGRFTGPSAQARVEVRNDGEIWVSNPSVNVTVGRQLALTMTYLKQ